MLPFLRYVFIFVWQMKKLFASILLLIYFTVSTGFVVSIHYCMDKVDSVQLGSNDSDECGKCGMQIEKGGGCCKDDVKLIQLKVDQPVAKMIVADFSILFPHTIVNHFFDTSFENHSSLEFPIAHSPPLHEPDIYLQNCVFRL
ncbi:MAG: hypothetical protein JWR72_3592 [Flavisolibacter sp.]|nr:hypothetical protein [Flavisolibacter sp.]